MRPPEKPQMAPYFIDRHNYVETFFHLLEQRDIIQFVGDTYSEYGTGKTTILSTLFYQIEAHYPHYKPLWLSLEQFSVHYRNPRLVELHSPAKDVLIRVQNLIDYHDLLAELGRECLPHIVNFPTILEGCAQGVLSRSFGALIDPDAPAESGWKRVMEEVKAGSLKRPEVEAAISEVVSRLTREFLDYYNPSIPAGQHVLLFADDYCWISDQPLGDWVINDLSPAMDRTWTIISRTTEQLDLRDRSRQIKNLYLTNFTPEEAAAYLHRRLGVAQLPPMVVENIYQYSKGHAQTISLVADLLQTSMENRPDLLVNFPRWKKGHYEDIIPELMTLLIEDTPQPWLRQALWLGIVARRFDADLLYRALKQDDALYEALAAGFVVEDELRDDEEGAGGAALAATGEAAGEDTGDDTGEDSDEDVDDPVHKARAAWCQERLLQAVTRYSFVEQHHDEHGIFYTFHNNMRDAVNEYLRDERNPHAATYAALHRALVDAYSEVLSGYQEQDPSARYVALYRYEDPTWQRMVSEWLYHISQISDRHEADLEFVNVYFIGFQWWDNYLPFEFCEHILEEWKRTQGDEAQSDAFRLVSEFAKHYPRGFHKAVRGHANWPLVQRLLDEIAALFQLFDTPWEDQSPKEQALRSALTEMYTASFRLSPEPDYARAEALYREAIQDAQDEGDDYNQSYAAAYFSDMLLELGRYDEAYAQAEIVNDLMQPDGPFDIEGDYEVVTLSYRVMGDCRLFQGRYDEVGPLYSRATMCGYAQNFALGHDPDPYTLQWYEDNVRLIAQVVIETAQAKDASDAIAAIVHEIHAAWESYWQARSCPVEAAEVPALLQSGDQARLRAFLAPPAPDPKRYPAETLQEELNRIADLFGVEIPDAEEAGPGGDV